jgi:hypothetical protein
VLLVSINFNLLFRSSKDAHSISSIAVISAIVHAVMRYQSALQVDTK